MHVKVKVVVVCMRKIGLRLCNENFQKNIDMFRTCQ